MRSRPPSASPSGWAKRNATIAWAHSRIGGTKDASSETGLSAKTQGRHRRNPRNVWISLGFRHGVRGLALAGKCSAWLFDQDRPLDADLVGLRSLHSKPERPASRRP